MNVIDYREIGNSIKTIDGKTAHSVKLLDHIAPEVKNVPGSRHKKAGTSPAKI
jgi:hypothetical protein